MVKEKHLLDILWEKVGCDYLSDQKTQKTRPAALSAIRQINKDDYSTEMWNETLSYIFGKRIIISSPRDVNAVINMRCLQCEV